MEKQGEQTGFSDEYKRFWELRGSNAVNFKGEKGPTTSEELEKANKRTSTLLALFQDPDFLPLRRGLTNLASKWMKDGKLTEKQHMEIYRTFETLEMGETTEEFVSKLDK